MKFLISGDRGINVSDHELEVASCLAREAASLRFISVELAGPANGESL